MEKKLDDLFQKFFRGHLDRREFLTRLAVVPGGVAAATAALPLLNSPKARAQMFIRGGTYSTAERDRRWANIRRMMSENGYDCLIVPKGMGDGINFLQYAEYVSNAFFMTPGAVVFPLEGEPAVVGAVPSPDPWIQQMTLKWFEGGEQTPIGELIVDLVNEMGLAGGNIAVVGTQAAVEGLNEFINEGFVKYATWATVMAGLPEATFTDITPEFAELVMVKGEEEQANIIGAAQVGEGLHAMLLDTIEVGLDAREVRVAVAEYLIRNDAASDVQALELAPGSIRDGQVINSEYGIIASGGYAQVTLCVACGSVSGQTEELAEIAHASMDYGAENLRAGARFGDVIAGMERDRHARWRVARFPADSRAHAHVHGRPRLQRAATVPALEDHRRRHRSQAGHGVQFRAGRAPGVRAGQRPRESWRHRHRHRDGIGHPQRDRVADAAGRLNHSMPTMGYPRPGSPAKGGAAP